MIAVRLIGKALVGLAALIAVLLPPAITASIAYTIGLPTAAVVVLAVIAVPVSLYLYADALDPVDRSELLRRLGRS